MSERYSRVFNLRREVYAEGSPLIIQAGALLRDSLTSSLLVQLKLRSISRKNIKAVKVSV